MIKDFKKMVFSNLSRGLFYTIGKIIAYTLISVVVYFVVKHLGGVIS